MKNQINPIVPNAGVKQIETISTKSIIIQYKEEFDIDVQNYFNQNEIHILECEATGYRFYNPQVQGEETLYQDLQRFDWYYRKWNFENETALKFIKPNMKCLEVGCGNGSFLTKLNLLGIDNTGLEFNKSAVEFCKKNKLNVFNETLEEHYNKLIKYDLVISFQVLEHVAEVKKFIEDILSVTNKGGFVIFSVPNCNPYYLKRDKFHTLNLPPHHVGLWNEETFKKLPNFFNFELIEIIHEPLDNILQYFAINTEYYLGKFLSKILVRITPIILIKQFFKLYKWDGKHLIAVFKKSE
jgi:2-polyprenyl-3-methyl-5-hydroxy-6-metoxy-1,4-benzoquinol methylase